MLADGKLIPDLPKRQLDALARLRLGHYERVALNIPGNPFGLAGDDLVFEKTDGKQTAALLGNVGGSIAGLCGYCRIVRAAIWPRRASAR